MCTHWIPGRIYNKNIVYRSEEEPPSPTSSNVYTDTSLHRDILTELEQVVWNGTTDSDKISRLLTELQTYNERQNAMLEAMSTMFGTQMKQQESPDVSDTNNWNNEERDSHSTSISLHKLVAKDTSHSLDAKHIDKTAAQEKFSAPSTYTPTCPSIDTATQSITWYGYENNADCSWLVAVPMGKVGIECELCSISR